jgi:hypothetical protein
MLKLIKEVKPNLIYKFWHNLVFMLIMLVIVTLVVVEVFC